MRRANAPCETLFDKKAGGSNSALERCSGQDRGNREDVEAPQMSLRHQFFGTALQVSGIAWHRLAIASDWIRHNPPQACESFTKLFVLASLLSAELIQDLLAARQAPCLPVLAGSAFVLSIVATRRWGDRVVGGILVTWHKDCSAALGTRYGMAAG